MRNARRPLASAHIASVLARIFGAVIPALVLLAGACAPRPALADEFRPDARQSALLDTLQERTFRFFWEQADPRTGLMPDRWPTRSFASVAATGFALTAYPIGAEHGWITRAQARERVLYTLRFFRDAPQDTTRHGATGYRGFYYHFLHPDTGHRFERVELSTVDTALLLGGALFCQSYFDQPDAAESELRALVDTLYNRADWSWAQVRPPTIGHGWSPEGGPLGYDWRGYNEAMLVYLIALGSTTHPIAPGSWSAWTSGYRWGAFEGIEHLGFAPMFGHQFTHLWVDFRGIRDAWLGEKGLDYFENSRRAAQAQVAYAERNPGGWTDYGRLVWGLSACDGPLDRTLSIHGRSREFHTYWARGASFTEVLDDGTLTPTAVGGSIPFAPELTIPALMEMRARYGEDIFSTYGFLDAYNPTFRHLQEPVEVHHGRLVPERGWFDTDYLGLDQGPILIMAENYRTGLVWKTMRRNAHLIAGLKAAGFSGGWIDSLEVSR